MIQKHFISAQELLEDSYRLGAQIIHSGFRPDCIVGIWRGGAPVGIAIQELLEYCHISTDHFCLRTAFYTGVAKTCHQVQIWGLEYLIQNLTAQHTLLIVDDVFDSGRSIEAVINELIARTHPNRPRQIRVATPWFKPNNNATTRIPDFYLHETDQWLVFPHKLVGLSEQELMQGKGDLFSIVQSTASP